MKLEEEKSGFTCYSEIWGRAISVAFGHPESA